MATSRLAQHLPSLFGPSRRAAWRLSLARRLLAVSAILLALQLVLGATGGESTEPVTDPVGDGPQLTLPLALPGDHLATGDEVDVYLAGRATPLATGARVTGTSEGASGQSVARVVLQPDEIRTILRSMGPGGASEGGFVVVTTG